MMNDHTRVLEIVPSAAIVPIVLVLLITTAAAAFQVGEVTHLFVTSSECIVLDPPAGAEVIKENVEPNDEFQIKQFITNRCSNTVDTSVAIDVPSVDYIRVTSGDEGTFSLSPGHTITAIATVTFGNDTPADADAKVKWKISRPE